MSRNKVIPFTDRHLAIIETFAAQAVIAIENARLFNELEARNREVSEALELQTVMAEVLQIVAGAPSDLDATLPQIAAAAMRLCDAEVPSIRFVGEGTVHTWNLGGSDTAPLEPAETRTFLDTVLHEDRSISVFGPINEWAAEYPGAAALFRRRPGPDLDMNRELAALAVPIPGRNGPAGIIMVVRDSIDRDGSSRAGCIPFAPRHTQILQTLADQAVIAIEKARLFNELQESNREVSEALRREEATGEILRQISRAPEELETTLQAITDAATRLTMFG